MKAKIQIERNNMLFRFGCYFCDSTIEKEDIRVKVYLDKEQCAVPKADKNPLVGLFSSQNQRNSYHVCWDCVKAGPLGMKKALVEQAKRLRKDAEDCDYTATHLEIECPPWDQIQMEKEKIGKELEKEYKEESKKRREENGQVEVDVPF